MTSLLNRIRRFFRAKSSRAPVSGNDVELCGEVTERVTDEMERMRSSTEEASLNIGELLNRIVMTTTEGNEEIKCTIRDAVGDGQSHGEDGENSASLTEAVAKQTAFVEDFISRANQYFDRCLEVSIKADDACRSIEASAAEVARLTSTSKLLSLNLRVEASRLGIDGRCFDALGQEVQEFSRSVETAADQIRRSVGVFLDTIPQMHRDAIQIREELGGVSEKLDCEMSQVAGYAQTVTDSLKATLDNIETRNNQVLQYSNETLSYLGFQDPVSQGLQRIQHDIREMNRMLHGEAPEFRSLSSIKDDVGDDGSIYRETGVVDLF